MIIISNDKKEKERKQTHLAPQQFKDQRKYTLIIFKDNHMIVFLWNKLHVH